MDMSRRGFVAGLAAAGIMRPGFEDAWTGPAGQRLPTQVPEERFDPWIEVDSRALHHNVDVVSRLAGNRPILAVIKNNAYGLGLAGVARTLQDRPEVSGFAVVKAEAALALRAEGVTKPVLLMALFTDAEAPDLIAQGIELALTTDDSPTRAQRASGSAGQRARVQYYVDTGMSRMGVPYHRALPWLERAAGLDLDVRGTFTALTEDPSFDREQIERFQGLADQARGKGAGLGRLHAASSNGVYHLPDGHLDQVRPGIALFGAYPSDADREASIAPLRCAVRLRARVVRTERLRAGDGVSYGQNYVAGEPTWIATLPVGHTDGVPRGAVRGTRVLIGDRTYPVIGAVSASHTIVEVGPEPTVGIGDVATLVGPDHPDILPNEVARTSDASVYDVLMHLNPSLPRFAAG